MSVGGEFEIGDGIGLGLGVAGEFISGDVRSVGKCVKCVVTVGVDGSLG